MPTAGCARVHATAGRRARRPSNDLRLGVTRRARPSGRVVRRSAATSKFLPGQGPPTADGRRQSACPSSRTTVDDHALRPHRAVAAAGSSAREARSAGQRWRTCGSTSDQGRHRSASATSAMSAPSTACSFSLRRGETLGLVGEIRLRQVDDRSRHHPALRADGRADRVRRHQTLPSYQGDGLRRCPPADADDLPGSVLPASTRV